MEKGKKRIRMVTLYCQGPRTLFEQLQTLRVH